MFMFAIFHFHYFSTGRCLLRQCDNTVPSPNILVMLLEDKKVVAEIADYGYIYRGVEERLQRRLQCPPQEWPLSMLRLECMLQKIKASNTSHITDQAVR